MSISFNHNKPVVKCINIVIREALICANVVCFLQNYEFQEEDPHIMTFRAQSGFTTGSKLMLFERILF